MKKTLLMLGVVTTLFSCSKDEEAALVVPEQTGTAVVSGIITREDNISNNEVAVQGACSCHPESGTPPRHLP